MKIERRTIGRFQSLTRMILTLGMVFIAGSVMAAMGKAPAQQTSGRSQAASAQQKLPAAAQSAISAALGRDQQAYHAVAIRKGFRMKNPRSNLQATFTRQGVRVESGKVSWGMTLVAFGASGKLQPVAATKPQANQNRVEYRREALTEWYVNGPVGLEQGFTIAKAPAGGANGTIELALRLTGNVTASVDAAKTGLILKGKQTSLRYSGLAARDANGRRLRSWLEVRNERLLVQVAAQGATYPLVVDPWMQVAELVASDGKAYDNLGGSVAISGDGSTVVVGAYSASVNSHIGQGAAYVFVKPMSGWSDTSDFVAKLTASDGAAGDSLGGSVSVSGDGSTVVVGAPYGTVDLHSGQGAAYVFVKPSSAWASETEAAKLTASDGAAGDSLGDSVSVSADGSTVVATAPYASVGSHSEQGAAYVFTEPSGAGGWAGESSPQTEVAKLTASDGKAYDNLGGSVAMSADGSTVVVGDPDGTVDRQFDQGAAYVFVKPSSAWASETEAAKLTASDGAQYEYLGAATSMSADGSTVVAGALNAVNDSGVKTGAAYVFVKPSSAWASETEAAKLTASDGAQYDQLGGSVAMSADGSTVVAGAPKAAVDSHSQEGAAYVFVKPSSAWASETEAAKLTPSDGGGGDNFGSSVSVAGSTAAVGAPYAAVNSQHEQGRAYVFSGSVQFMSFNASKLRITLGPPSEFEFDSSFVLGSDSNGINPLTEPVTLKIGSLFLTIPAGSFHLQHKRSNVYVFSGVVDGFTVNAKFESTDFYDWTFKANGSSPNGLSITNPVTVTLSIGNDSGTVTETVPIN